MSLTVPKSLEAEHDHLHQDLKAAIAKGGHTGEAARVVAGRLHPHFQREEEIALPPLGLLAALSGNDGAAGISAAEADRVIKMADQLAADLPRMLTEHQTIVAALRSLIAAAHEENNREVAEFAERLMLHAQTEEEVLYPAAIIIGRYLKLAALSKSKSVSAAPI